MHKTQLFSILQKFSTREKSRFRAFLESPFFNKNKHIQSLGKYILHTKIESSNNQLDRLIVYREVFRGEKYNETKFNNLVSDTLQLVYQFLAHTQVEKNALLQQQLLQEHLQDKDLESKISRTSQRFLQLQEKSPYRNYQFFYYKYQYYDALDAAFLAQSKHSQDSNLQSKSDQLDLYFMANKLRIACDMLSRNIVINAQYKSHLLSDILKYYEQHQARFEQIPALSIYHQVYLMLSNLENEENYQEVKLQLARHWQLFPPEEARTLYSFVLNYGVRKINSGKSHFYKEILNLYQFLLEQKIIIKNDSITRWTFTNILMAAIRLREFDWAEYFILTYDKYLSEQERLNVVTYNLANLYYEKKDFQKALQTLHNVEFNDPSYHTGAKIIQMKCYYELDETEAFFALVDAFKMYILRSKKLSAYQKRANKNMLTLATKIYKLQLAKGRINKEEYTQRHQKILKRLENANPIANKSWLNTIFLTN